MLCYKPWRRRIDCQRRARFLLSLSPPLVHSTSIPLSTLPSPVTENPGVAREDRSLPTFQNPRNTNNQAPITEKKSAMNVGMSMGMDVDVDIGPVAAGKMDESGTKQKG